MQSGHEARPQRGDGAPHPTLVFSDGCEIPELLHLGGRVVQGHQGKDVHLATASLQPADQVVDDRTDHVGPAEGTRIAREAQRHTAVVAVLRGRDWTGVCRRAAPKGIGWSGARSGGVQEARGQHHVRAQKNPAKKILADFI
eukprot:3959038-Prymnesium_polylepis.1